MFLQILKCFTVATQCVWRVKLCADATQRDDRGVQDPKSVPTSHMALVKLYSFNIHAPLWTILLGWPVCH